MQNLQVQYSVNHHLLFFRLNYWSISQARSGSRRRYLASQTWRRSWLERSFLGSVCSFGSLENRVVSSSLFCHTTNLDQCNQCATREAQLSEMSEQTRGIQLEPKSQMSLRRFFPTRFLFHTVKSRFHRQQVSCNKLYWNPPKHVTLVFKVEGMMCVNIEDTVKRYSWLAALLSRIQSNSSGLTRLAGKSSLSFNKRCKINEQINLRVKKNQSIY